MCIKRGKERPTAQVAASEPPTSTILTLLSLKLLPKAPSPKHLVGDQHQRLIAEVRHGRLRSQPPMQSPLKRQHLALLHAQVGRTQRLDPSLQLQAVPELSTALLQVHGVTMRENSRRRGGVNTRTISGMHASCTLAVLPCVDASVSRPGSDVKRRGRADSARSILL